MQLTLAGVSHTFERQSALFSSLDLEISGGEIVALTGPSGSGKSTLLAIIAGSLQPTAGFVSRENINSISWVFQNPHGSPRRAAVDHVALPFLGQGHSVKDAREQAVATLQLFGLEDVAERRFAQLSGGQAQRLMLARAVACAPAMLLVDEPTAQLDQASALSVIDRIGELAAPDRIVVISTHDPRLSELATREISLGQL